MFGVAYRQLGLKLREADSAQLSEFAIRAGIETASDLASLIDPSGDRAAAYADDFVSRMHRRPSPRELLFGMLKPVSSEDDLEEQLARPVPPNVLDDLDPDIELE